ncbi:hypothetical protein WMY93_005624 [Mugilogobius chulae]|uniref:Dentin sialophosphoprotein-like n=1 Tax=Mugilogobius chulae TaxID=88201 RepID=A0AAW0PT69_9GOBI
MNVIVILFCLFCAVFTNPITININMDSSELNTNSTDTLLVAQAAGNDTSEVQSSESESSESVESASSDSTSEESDSIESNEHTEMLVETRDDSMGSEENVRKSWVRVFATVIKSASVEDNSTEVTSQQPELINKLAEKQPLIQVPTSKTQKQSGHCVSESSSESAESTDRTALMTDTVDSSSQSLSSESNETSSSEASDSGSDSAHSSQSHEDSHSAELKQLKHCVNGTHSCESQEYFFQDIGDDANYSVDNLMVPDEDERELSLRR